MLEIVELLALLEEPATGPVAPPSFGKSQQGRGGQQGEGTGRDLAGDLQEWISTSYLVSLALTVP